MERVLRMGCVNAHSRLCSRHVPSGADERPRLPARDPRTPAKRQCGPEERNEVAHQTTGSTRGGARQPGTAGGAAVAAAAVRGSRHHEAMQEMFRHQPGQPPIVLHGRIDESEIQSIGVTSC
eukprot:3664662-Rhodomonas_salina.1